MKAALCCLLLAACGPDTHRTGGAVDYGRPRAPYQPVSVPYCGASVNRPWADCVVRCVPEARVYAVCHKNGDLPPNYYDADSAGAQPVAESYAAIQTGALCDGAPSWVVVQLQRDTRSYDMLDGGAMGSWPAATLADCALPGKQDPFFYETRQRSVFYTGEQVQP